MDVRVDEASPEGNPRVLVHTSNARNINGLRPDKMLESRRAAASVSVVSFNPAPFS
jgi:hypothetical protein